MRIAAHDDTFTDVKARFLNGVKVHSAILRDGDVIQLADNVFVYHED